MRMIVAQNVTLTKPLADGLDYAAGDVIELSEAVAESWKRRGWVVDPLPDVPLSYKRLGGKSETRRG